MLPLLVMQIGIPIPKFLYLRFPSKRLPSFFYLVIPTWLCRIKLPLIPVPLSLPLFLCLPVLASFAVILLYVSLQDRCFFLFFVLPLTFFFSMPDCKYPFRVAHDIITGFLVCPDITSWLERKECLERQRTNQISSNRPKLFVERANFVL